MLHQPLPPLGFWKPREKKKKMVLMKLQGVRYCGFGLKRRRPENISLAIVGQKVQHVHLKVLR